MPSRESSQGARPGATGAWSEHEHLTPAVQNEAQRLVVRSGSPELAKQAIDAAAHRTPPAASQKDQFARDQGYTSYLELFEASTVVRTNDGKHWFVSALPSGHPLGHQWMLWNEEDLAVHSLHSTLAAAQQQFAAD